MNNANLSIVPVLSTVTVGTFGLDNPTNEANMITMNNIETFTVADLARSFEAETGLTANVPLLSVADISDLFPKLESPVEIIAAEVESDSIPDRAERAFEKIKRSRRFGKKAPFFDLETKERYYAPEDILAKCSEDPEFMGRCITFLFLEQTGDERVQRTTKWDNDRGFSLRTVTKGTLIANLLDAGNHLIPGTPWYIEAEKIVYHHRQQLANQANRLACLEVLPF